MATLFYSGAHKSRKSSMVSITIKSYTIFLHASYAEINSSLSTC